VVSTIEEIRDRLVETLEPESIIILGSRARGTAGESSDYDLLIVADVGNRPIERRMIAE
jgi:predicted nucleotidyltransferase